MSDSTTNPPKIYIYALIDPFTDEIRYIGKSVRPKERLTNQCNEHANTHRCHWIQSVLAKGKRPIQKILEVLPPGSDWQSREKYWIAYGKQQDWPLTNGTSGGDGLDNPPEHVKKKIRKTWLGRKHKPESLKKIGAASRGRKFSPEALRKKSEAMKGRVFSKEHLSKIARSNEKLTTEQVQEIRRLMREGISQYVIADMFGVHQGTISNIKRGVSYSHIPDSEGDTNAG